MPRTTHLLRVADRGLELHVRRRHLGGRRRRPASRLSATAQYDGLECARNTPPTPPTVPGRGASRDDSPISPAGALHATQSPPPCQPHGLEPTHAVAFAMPPSISRRERMSAGMVPSALVTSATSPPSESSTPTRVSPCASKVTSRTIAEKVAFHVGRPVRGGACLCGIRGQRHRCTLRTLRWCDAEQSEERAEALRWHAGALRPTANCARARADHHH